MNVSAVTLRLLLIITAYMDDLLHEDTNIFPVNNTDFLFTRNIADSHGFSFLFFLVPNYRIIEFCLHTEYRGQSRISFFFLFLSRIIELSNFCLP